jgi:hypothetical protein
MFQRSPAIVPSLALGMAKLGFFISAFGFLHSQRAVALEDSGDSGQEMLTIREVGVPFKGC